MSSARSLSLRGGVAAKALLALALATTARAAEPDQDERIALSVTACSEPFEASLRRILQIELGDLLDEPGAAPGAEAESLEIACEAEMARISARSSRGEVAHNDLSFDAFPGDAAPRAVALAGLEALRAVDPKLAERIVARRAKQAEPARTVEPAPKPPPPAPSRSRPRRKARAASGDESKVVPRALTRVMLGGVARLFLGEPRTLSGGGRLELSRRFAAPWDAGVDVDGTFARRRVELGALEARSLSTAVWLGLRVGGAVWSMTGGAGGRVGVVALSGDAKADAVRAHRATRPWGGPLLVLRTDGSLGVVAMALALEGGVAAAGAEGLARGTPALGFTGAWASVSANVGLRY